MDREATMKLEQKSSKTSARAVALETLIKILNQKSYSNIALNQALNDSGLSEKDKGLATNIVYGTIQYKIFLEYQLKPLIKGRLKDKFMKPLLLMSAYQYFFLKKVPTNAIFDEANKLAKKFSRRNSGAFKMVNGILRSLDRQGEILPSKDDAVKYLSVKESYPEWMVEYFIKIFGLEKAKKILASANQPAPNSIRLTVAPEFYSEVEQEIKQDGFEYQVAPLTNHNLLLNHGGIAQTDLFKKGKVTIQDSAASLAVDAFDFKGNEEVLDACSAPGGKTVQIAENLTTGSVVALDIHEHKLDLIKKAAKRLGVADKITTKKLDARKASEYFSKEKFDKILVDAPCSGLGLIRRKPEIRYDKTLKDIENLSKIQQEILDKVAPTLKKGGELVYATCTITTQEDEEVVEKFLQNHPDFSLEPIQVGNLPKQKMVKILPDEYESDGFFIAKLKKRG